MMEKALLLSAAYGWFAGLLIIMVVVTALFALILFIALKPIKKDELDESTSAKKALVRRETELTIELLNKQNDAKTRAELEGKLREVKSAEKLVGELMPEEEAPAKKAKPSKAPKKGQPAKAPQQKPAPKPAQPAKGQPADRPAPKPVKPAANVVEVSSEGEKKENK